MVNCYESRVIPSIAGNEALQKRIALLEQSGKEMKEALTQSEARAGSLETLKLELAEAKKMNETLEQMNRCWVAEVNSFKGACKTKDEEISGLRAELKELTLRNEALIKLRDHDLKASAHSARKAVKTRGQILFEDISEYFRRANERKKTEADLADIASNRLLLTQIAEGKISIGDELDVLEAELKKANARLSSLPPADFDLQKYAEYFVDSPPIDETGPSLSCEERLSEELTEVPTQVEVAATEAATTSTSVTLEVNFIIPSNIYQFGSNFYLLGCKQVSELRTPAASDVNAQLASSDVDPQLSEMTPAASIDPEGPVL